ncbi:MAG: hypothetical protein IT182_11455 [Acidobacteria bacterium]|nr:hypothetical protein [Acidobacteriota bacterium]
MTAHASPHRYHLAGLNIISDFVLPEAALASPTTAAATLVVEDGWRLGLPCPADGAGRTADSSRVRFAAPGVGRFIVEHGCRVIAWPEAGVSDGDVSQQVLGPALALALMQQGHLVLHGAVIAVDDRAVVLLGDSGMGKSTTAAACAVAGHAVLSDDLAVVDCTDDGEVLVRPVAALVRLATAPLVSLGTAPRWTSSDKSVHATAVNCSSHDRRPLGGCVALTWGESLSLDRVAPVEAALLLVEHAFCRTAFGPAHAAAALRQCATLAERHPVARLARPSGSDSLVSAVSILADYARNVR